MNNRITTKEYFSIKILNLANFGGKIVKSIFDPSKGGRGIRLNRAKTTLTITTIAETSTKLGESERTSDNLIKTLKIIAMRILTAGPTPATIASPHL